MKRGILDINYDDEKDTKLSWLKASGKKPTYKFEVMDEYDFNLPSTLHIVMDIEEQIAKQRQKGFSMNGCHVAQCGW